MQPIDDLRAAKAAARRAAKARRREAKAAAGPEAGERARDHLLAILPGDLERRVSAYWPIDDEFDVRPMLAWFASQGWACGLPALVGRDRPLEFRRWHPGDLLVTGQLGTSEPASGAPVMVPVLLLVPLLAFDRQGHRLGYGGGYYDRTLAGLRAGRRILAVGVAFAGQAVDHVPHGLEDQRLDWVVTEEGATRVDNSEKSGATR